MDVRIGFPNEHLAKGTPDELASPMYATGIGLVIEGISRHDNEEEVERLKGHTEPDEDSKQETKKSKPAQRKSQSYLEKVKKLFDRDLIE